MNLSFATSRPRYDLLNFRGESSFVYFLDDLAPLNYKLVFDCNLSLCVTNRVPIT